MARKKVVKKAARAKSKGLVKLSSALPSGYGKLLEELKTRVRAAQQKAILNVNRELIGLYWDIGRLIVQRQEDEGWGRSVVERLAVDMQRSFPAMQGFSARNIWRMRSFYLAYRPNAAILPTALAEIAVEP